jgi:hypothetical protein
MTKLPPGIPNASITIWSFLVLLLLFVILSVHLTVYFDYSYPRCILCFSLVAEPLPCWIGFQSPPTNPYNLFHHAKL